MSAVFVKKKWIGITSCCNNRCEFCLDGMHKKRLFKTADEVKGELLAGREEGCVKAVISGGEASIHPEFLRIVQEAKAAGYRKIQTISNGRMFSIPRFIDKAVRAGLDEITFSIHGHDDILHDRLTNTPGSFRQAVKGIENSLSRGLIVNADIVLNRQNVMHFADIIGFLLAKGVREFDVLLVMPYGDAWTNRERLLFDVNEEAGHLRKGFDIALQAGAVVWTNRFPPSCLEGYEHLIQDPIKLLDEVRGREEDFIRARKLGQRLGCFGERCKFCCMKGLCDHIYEHFMSENPDPKDDLREQEVTFMTREWAGNPIAKPGSILAFPAPAQEYEKYHENAPNIAEIRPALTRILDQGNNHVADVPPCMLEKRHRKRVTSLRTAKRHADLNQCASQYIGRVKTKSARCRQCSAYESCEGMFLKYVMTYGYKELLPWTDC